MLWVDAARARRNVATAKAMASTRRRSSPSIRASCLRSCRAAADPDRDRLNFVLSKYVIPAFDHSYLGTAKFKNVDLKKVLAIWAIIGAMASAIVAIVLLNRRRIGNLVEALNSGTLGSLLPMANTASEVGYGAVIAALAAFAVVREGLKSLAGDPVISLWLVVTVLAAMTGSASGGMSLALGAMASTTPRSGGGEYQPGDHASDCAQSQVAPCTATVCRQRYHRRRPAIEAIRCMISGLIFAASAARA